MGYVIDISLNLINPMSYLWKVVALKKAGLKQKQGGISYKILLCNIIDYATHGLLSSRRPKTFAHHMNSSR